MKKYLVIGLVAIISLELVIQLIISIVARKQALPPGSNEPSPSIPNLLFPGTTNKGSPAQLTITAVTPADGSTNISLNNKVRITFNKKITAKDVTAWLGPDITYTTDIHDYWLTIIPSAPFTENTTYYFAVKFSDQSVSQTYSFTTTGLALKPTDNPLQDDFGKVTLSRDKTLHPDNYVNYFLPRSTDTFYASGDQTDTPTPHIYFSVIMMGDNQDQSKQDFIDYVKSLGLTDDQIQRLDIRYKSPQINAY